MKRWCPECRRRAEVVDTSTEGGYAHGREYAIRVDWLACDHYAEGERVDVGRAPGAPWAPGAAPTVARRFEGRPIGGPLLADPFLLD